MRERYLFIVGGRLAVLGGARPSILTIARLGISVFGPGGTVIRASLLALTTWDLTDTRVLSVRIFTKVPYLRQLYYT